MAHGPVDYWPDGSIKSVGGERASYYPDGSIKSVGDKAVSYYPDGSIKGIGDERVDYYPDGSIKSVGGRSVDYYPDGSVKSIPDSGGSWSGSNVGSSGWEAALVLLMFILAIGIASFLIKLLVKILTTLWDAYRQLIRQHPRAMLVVHLLVGMVAVGFGLAAAGFDPGVQVAGILLVPGLWGWLWLTRKVPTIFLPINALLTGGALWLVAQVARASWLPTWSRLTVGLPLLGNLSIVLAVLPMSLLLLGAGARRWPQVFTPINLLIVGAVMWFALTRVWTDWIPLWKEWTAPVPLMPPLGWIVFLIPLVFWLWRKGQSRWPVPFFVANLLLFGGLLGLTAYHTQPAWIAAWRHWTVGLPFAGMPIFAISLSPAALYTWTWVSRRWVRWFIVPNLLLTGGIFWLVLDRTRPLWTSSWQVFWGEALPLVDLAALIAVLPLITWAWRQSSRRWPRFGVASRVFLLGALLWWIGERTRIVWQDYWWSFAGRNGPNLAVLAGITPPLLWSWAQLRKRWTRVSTAIGLAVLSLGLSWITGRLLPASTLVLRVAVVVIPWIAWGWGYLLRHRAWLGWILVSLPLIGLGLLGWLGPTQLQMLVQVFLHWLAEQGVPVPLTGM